MPASKSSNSLLKRIVAYVFLVSVVCVFSRYRRARLAVSWLCWKSGFNVCDFYYSNSGLSLMSSAIFQFIGKRRRTRASRKLPVVEYRRNLQRRLLQQLLEQQNVIDHIPLDDDLSGDEYDDHHHFSLAAMVGSSADVGGDEETCSICLDDFTTGVIVKVQ